MLLQIPALVKSVLEELASITLVDMQLTSCREILENRLVYSWSERASSILSRRTKKPATGSGNRWMLESDVQYAKRGKRAEQTLEQARSLLCIHYAM